MSHTAAEPKSRTLAIVAITVAGTSLLLGVIPFVAYAAFLLGPIGFVLGLVAWLRARKGEAEGRGLALAALIASVASIVAALAIYAYLFTFLLSL